MIDLQRALRHLAWSDAWLFDTMAAYPDDAFEARYAPQASSVGELLKHIVDGAEWYRYCLTGESWTDIGVPHSGAEVTALAAHLASIDRLLLAQAEMEDEVVVFRDEEGESRALRSTILTQACLHAIEHRAQIACALEVAEFPPLPLDDVDLWAFEMSERAEDPGTKE